MTATNNTGVKASFKSPLILIGCVIVGGILGLVLGEKAPILKPIGQVFINLLFTIMTPLVFFSIAGSIAAFNNMQRLGKILGTILTVFVVTGAISGVIMVAVVKSTDIARGLVIGTADTTAAAALSIGDHLVKMFTVSDFPLILSKSAMLPLIVFAIFFGLGTALLGEEGKPVARALDAANRVILKMIGMLMYIAPICLGAYFADLTGVHGPKLVGTYARVMAVFYSVVTVYFFSANTIYCYIAGGVEGIRAFFKNMLAPALTAMGMRSSAAMIPIQMDVCHRIGVPKDISGMVIPMGATMHMDGSAIGVVTKIAVACAICNVPFDSFGAYAFAVFMAVICGIAISAGLPLTWR